MNRIILRYEKNLPMPLIYLASAGDLSKWYVSQMEQAVDQGHRELFISCFDTTPMGFDTADAAYAILQEIATFLAISPIIDTLTILCGDEETLHVYGQLLSKYQDRSQSSRNHL